MMVIAGSRSNESSWKACCNVLRCKSMACPEATCKRVTTGQPAHLEHSHGRVRDDDARPVGERVVGLRVSRRLKPARARLAQPPSQAHGRTEAWQCTVYRMQCRADRSTARAWQAHGHAGQCRTPRLALAYSAASPSAAAPLPATRAVQGATVRHALRLIGAGHSREVAAARTRKGAVHHGPRPARQQRVSATSGAVTGGCGRTGRRQCCGSADGSRTDKLGEEDAHHGHHRHAPAGARPHSGSARSAGSTSGVSAPLHKASAALCCSTTATCSKPLTLLLVPDGLCTPFAPQRHPTGTCLNCTAVCLFLSLRQRCNLVK